MMTRLFSICVVTLALGIGTSAQNRTPASPQTSKPQDGKPVMMSGCLTGGPSSYTLSNVAITPPIHEGPERPIGTAGAALSYTLTARDGVDFAKHVGKKVEIRGVLLPMATSSVSKSGDRERPGVKQDDNPDARPSTAASGNAKGVADIYPTVAVTAVRMLSGTCQ